MKTRNLEQYKYLSREDRIKEILKELRKTSKWLLKGIDKASDPIDWKKFHSEERHYDSILSSIEFVLDNHELEDIIWKVVDLKSEANRWLQAGNVITYKGFIIKRKVVNLPEDYDERKKEFLDLVDQLLEEEL